MRMNDVVAVIMGGGEGKRLYPLTRDRAKPAVPLAGQYRLIDIPMSNCLHAGIEKIAILTQFNSVSLHRHIYRTYTRDVFSKGWVQILAAEQTHRSVDWYQGTADAVRKQLVEIQESGAKHVLILAGDHLYRMDYAQFINHHVETNSDISIAVQPVERRLASSLGILKLDKDAQIVRFVEKPQTDDQLKDLESGNDLLKPFMASMGIYVFKIDVLVEMLSKRGNDFGHDIIPAAIGKKRVSGYIFDGYWQDIGTIRRFYDVNLELARADAPFDFYNAECPIYTNPRFLPSSLIDGGIMENMLVADGCRVFSAEIRDAVIGLRSIIARGTKIHQTIIMGADYYETEADIKENRRIGQPDIGIGENTTIKRAIIDKNARIGRNVRIEVPVDHPNEEFPNWVIKDGIVIVPKYGVIPDNTVVE